MKLQLLEYLFILLFLVLFFNIIRKALKTPQVFPDYFTGGQNIHWVSIAVTIISVNISFMYLVGAASMGYNKGMALGSYEWSSVVAIIFASLYIIPRFMRLGILTLPEYLERRFDRKSRIIMAAMFLFVILSFIIFDLMASALFVEKLLNLDKAFTIIIIAVIGGGTVFFGGAVSRIKLNYILVSFFLIMGILLIVFCFIKTGGIENYAQNADGRLRSLLPADDEVLPWTTVFLGGLWILHLNYWAFNPQVNHAALGAKTLSQMQKGMLLVATVKLIIPFIMITPGIVGYELYKNEITDPNLTLPVVIQNVVPAALTGIFTMGYLGTLFAAFSVLLNTATSLFALDIFGSLSTKTSGEGLIKVARIFIVAFLIVAVIASYLFHPSQPIFKYGTIILELIAPISASVYLVGLYSKKTPALAAHVVLIAGVPIFLLIREYVSFSPINQAAFAFFVLSLIMLLVRYIKPLKHPVELNEKQELKFERNIVIEIWSIFIITAMLTIYVVF